MTKVTTTVGAKQLEWQFDADGSILLEGKKLNIEIKTISPQTISIIFEGRSYFVVVEKEASGYRVTFNGKTFEVLTENSLKKSVSRILGSSKHLLSVVEIRSPMPGMVVRCEVEEGAQVKIDQGLLILEAMKMENEIRAPKEGKVKKIFIREKQIVEKGELLLLIE